MKFFNIVAAALMALLPAMFASAQAFDAPELGIVTTFPNNPFSIVKNGQPNTVVFSITNPPKEDRLLTLQSVTGAFLNTKKNDGQKGRVLRNMTTTTFKFRPLQTVGGKPVQIPYNFVPEFKPQTDMGVEFILTVNDEQTGKKHLINAYHGTVEVIEPPKDWFDLQLISIYLLGLAVLGGAGAFAYTTYINPESKKKTPSAKKVVDEKKVDRPTLVQTKSGGYEEEWIPEHVLRARKNKSALSSGDDEPTSPTRKRKGVRK